MINRHPYKKTEWVDLYDPTTEEIRKVMSEFKFDLHIADELVSPSPKPRAELHGDYIYLILHFPSLKHSHTSQKNQEIDFVIGKRAIITARYDSNDTLQGLGKVLEVESVLNKKSQEAPHAVVFFKMIEELYGSIFNELDYIRDWMRGIEDEIFEGKEKEMVYAISEVTRQLLFLKQSIRSHRETLSTFSHIWKEFFGTSFRYRLQTVMDEFHKINNEITSSLELVGELRETNLGLLSTKQNEAMKVLTVMAFITFPLSLLAGIFGMNTSSMPIVGHPYDFAIIVGIMLLAMGCMSFYFKKKNWL
jgi:magnesium transporter